MGSLSERRQLALEKYRQCRRLSHSHSHWALKRVDKALHELLEICATELAEALTEGSI